MDIAQEIEKHLEWIDAVASLLDDEKLAEEDVRSVSRHDQCELGKWLDSEASQALRGSPEFHKLVASHQAFHDLAGKMILSLQQGRDSEAVEAHGQFIRMSREVIGLLQALQADSNETRP
jgi:hypothetical protein